MQSLAFPWGMELSSLMSASFASPLHIPFPCQQFNWKLLASSLFGLSTVVRGMLFPALLQSRLILLVPHFPSEQ